MSEPSIIVRDLRKEFTVNTSGAGSFKTALLWWKRRGKVTFEVLKGLNFQVGRGECVAIIGRNGAGKSTLLSILARIYRPSEGSVEINGRLAPLLELGAGFHPDLTGAENIFFNGVILGLTRREVRSRIDEIVEFSELHDHIHAPIRTYSSGMLARLGFAIAVHVDADILLVDEVLAVGDFEFEQKCYRKIEEFRASGGTILMVSHQFEDIERAADRCIWIQHGVVEMEGAPSDVIAAYRQRSEADL